jgi:hypothetical protein
MAQITLDLTASFANVISPTPFATYDTNTTFQADADGMVKLAYNRLGGNILQVEITNKDVYACLEQSMLEYSAIVNSYHAKSILANVIGSPTGSLSGSQNKVPRMDITIAKRLADGYSTEAQVGGTKTLFSSSISLVVGQQNYDLKVALSSSGLVIPPSQRAEIRDIFHFSPTAAYRFFDTTSAVNFLHNQFKFESFTPETIFYMLPIWEDVLRAQQLEQSHRIRRSNYSYNIVNGVLSLYPVPSSANNLYFTYYLVGDNNFDDTDPMTNGVSNLSNIPFGNIDYGKINSMGRQWVRRFALALAQETLGRVRSKVSNIPIPNGDLTLDGAQLVADAQVEKLNLRQELKEWLDSMTYNQLAAKETEQAENLQRQLNKVPLLITMG